MRRLVGRGLVEVPQSPHRAKRVMLAVVHPSWNNHGNRVRACSWEARRPDANTVRKRAFFKARARERGGEKAPPRRRSKTFWRDQEGQETEDHSRRYGRSAPFPKEGLKSPPARLVLLSRRRTQYPKHIFHHRSREVVSQRSAEKFQACRRRDDCSLSVSGLRRHAVPTNRGLEAPGPQDGEPRLSWPPRSQKENPASVRPEALTDSENFRRRGRKEINVGPPVPIFGEDIRTPCCCPDCPGKKKGQLGSVR
ncbi:hypothetical protein E2C01_054265 [Portunus trituberculatus]|uniref:Uncharacterized protein n=1 Tax=Portunus trituberculatus TaxID=210409 RepID=A0A5B7GRH8_PORTR|nr:hypothetical protein [Portunus trituberculatus]